MSKLIRRWMIKGRLTTSSPLHIGSGFQRPRLSKRKSVDPVKVAEITKNVHGLPYIPGSTLKGNLRAYAVDLGRKGSPAVESLFGSLDPKISSSKGGKADFFDAHAVPDVSLKNPPPHWDSRLMTGILTSTQINRRTRTVAEKKLFHTEYVPEGVAFDVRIGGQDTDGETGFDEIEELLSLFEGFNREEVRLGGDGGNGWGGFKWELTDLLLLDSNGAQSWASSMGGSVGYSMLLPVAEPVLGEIRHGVASRVANPVAPPLSISITLKFEGSFLVDDPSKKVKDESAPGDREGKPADHEPLLDVDGRPFLPSSSFRGAFRSQAERILRTIGGDNAACYPDGSGPRPTCRPVADVAKVKTLCPACQLFGATGWKSPVDIQPFKPSGPIGEAHLQDFVAIDRFTGGAAEGAKFDARSFYRPVLSGAIQIRLDRLPISSSQALLGLLLLTLRDLEEGDIRFGFGASKGYGACTASIDAITGGAGISAPIGFLDEVKDYFGGPRSGKTFPNLIQFVDELHTFSKSGIPATDGGE